VTAAERSSTTGRAEATPDTPEDGPQPAPSGAQPGNAGPTIPEIGGPKGPEPTRYGDWERNGRCSDF
jgi:hypothetical protein